MKGRIIGREGRNIRALENVTGVDFIIDDTPQAVVLSSFDGVRREVAKLTLQKLVEDGRIHPSRIEEMYYESKAEIEEHITQMGEQAVFEANIGSMHEELVKLLGRLRYRTSYGQNILKHSLECAHLAGIMAAELGASVKTAKRAALLHDLGKAMTHEVEGSHALIGASWRSATASRDAVVHAIEAHHYEVQPDTIEAILVIAADSISASRPGARGESLEHYIKRLETLEKLAAAKKGVERVYALQAGREIRVMVQPGGDRRRRGRAPVPRDRPRDRAAARVPGPDQGHGHPRVARDRVRQVAGYDSAMKRFHVTTFGCQMNAHDSERIKGMLESIGLGEAVSQDEADVIVFNTCTIREKPDQRLAAHLAQARALKEAEPERVIAVGGCYAEAQRERIFELYPFVDVAFGPGLDPASRRLDRRGGHRRRPRPLRHRRADVRRRAARAPRARAFQAWVQVSMGCNSKCAYCIVPSVRGREVSRRPGEIVAEVDRARARRRPRADAARPERELVGPRPGAGDPHRVRRAAARLRRGRRDRADPLHEPAPEGLPRAGDRRDGRVRRRVRARSTCRSSRGRAGS